MVECRGNFFLISRTTLSPPKPESKNPIIFCDKEIRVYRESRYIPLFEMQKRGKWGLSLFSLVHASAVIAARTTGHCGRLLFRNFGDESFRREHQGRNRC